MMEAAAAAGLEILERQDNMQDDAAGSQKIVESLLAKYPDVQAVWCFNDRSALGASAALRAAGYKIYNEASPEDGAVMVTGMNGTQEAIEAVHGHHLPPLTAGTPSWSAQPDRAPLPHRGRAERLPIRSPRFISARTDRYRLDRRRWTRPPSRWRRPSSSTYYDKFRTTVPIRHAGDELHGVRRDAVAVPEGRQPS